VMPACRGHPLSQMLRRKAAPGYNSNVHTKARFAPDDKQNSFDSGLFCRDPFGKR